MLPSIIEMHEDSRNPFETLHEAIRKTRLPLPEASQLPGEVYCSPSVYALEKERIFLETWLCVGREDQIPEPGDYFTARIVDEPFIVARNRDREIGAFMN